MINSIFNFISSLRQEKAVKKNQFIKSQNIYVVGFQISGNSWISYLISYILNCNYTDIDEFNESVERKSIKEYLNGSLEHSGSKHFVNVLKTHEKIKNLELKDSDKVVYVVRDIKDATNSYFQRFERKYNLSNHAIPLIKRTTYTIIKLFIPFKIRFKLITRFLAHEWVNHADEISTFKNITLIKYEDMIDEPLKTIERIIKKIDHDAWNEKVALEAIDHFSFNNMKKIAVKEVGSNKTTDRVGTYGDWKNYFSNSDKIYFDKVSEHANKKIKLYL